MKNSFLLATLVVGLLSCSAVFADDASGSKISDPAFDMYVNPETLELARNNADASLMLDVSMQLAEGERVLLRSHKAVSSDDMLKLAARVAAAKDDKATQERLKKAVEKLGKGNLTAEFDSIAKLAGASRGADTPKFSTGDDQAATEMVAGLVESVNDAALLQNRAKLDEIEKSLKNLPLSEKVHGELAAFVTKSKEGIPADAASKLSGASRNEPVRQIIVPGQQPHHHGYWSPKLRAAFVVTPSGARVLNVSPGSPLSGVVSPGDVITHLDGMRVNCEWELENHYSWTTVDYRCDEGFPHRATIYIQGGPYGHDHGHGHIH